MARPKKGVTKDNVLYVDRYFSRAIRYDRLYTNGWFKTYSRYSEAKIAFESLPSVNWKVKRSIENRQANLQLWIDSYISDERWQRCLLTLRQQKSYKRLNLKSIALPIETYESLKILANHHKVSIKEIIKNLAETTLKKMKYKN